MIIHYMTAKTETHIFVQGQRRVLSSFQNLEISDENNLEDVKVSVLRGAKHGKLITARKFFTPADLDAGLVIYKHDGSNTYR